MYMQEFTLREGWSFTGVEKEWAVFPQIESYCPNIIDLMKVDIPQNQNRTAICWRTLFKKMADEMNNILITLE